MRILFLIGLFLAQQPDSTLIQDQLDSTVFVSERHVSLLETDPALPIKVNTELLRRIPSLTGTPDPIRIVKLLPGVETGTELDAGLHILGTENSHSLVSVDGVPIYGATHVLGLFSTFISSHFQGMEFHPYISGANRIGGAVDMQLPGHVPAKFHGQVSASLFEAEGTLDIPTGRRSALFVSARRSFINLLYSSFLKVDVYAFRYGFTDGNITWYWEPGEKDRFWADFMLGGDNAHFQSNRGGYGLKFDWMNYKGSLHHRHQWDWGELRQRLYYSHLDMSFDFNHDIYNLYVPSIFGTAGYSATLRAGRWEGEVRLEGHHSKPQQTIVRNKDVSQMAADESQAALEASTRVQYTLPITSSLELSASLKGIWWHSADGANYPALVPQLRLLWDAHHAGKFELVTGLERQNLFQTGISSIGLPIEFWYLSGKNLSPQGSCHASVSWGRSFLSDRYSVSVGGFYRHLMGQLDYTGTLLDYLDPDYTTPKYLITGFGRNFGLCLTLHKQAGDFTGWMNYTLARSLRTFGEQTYPSNHERIHEFNAVGNYTHGRWDFGGVFVLASGVPYTAAEAFLMSGGTLVAEMSPKNYYRMKPYLRLDLSASFYFHRQGDGRGNGLTLALYNAVGYKNDLFFMPMKSNDEHGFYYAPVSLHLRWLPSLSYFHKF